MAESGGSVGTHALDKKALSKYLQSQPYIPSALRSSDSARLFVKQFGHGQSNPTYLIRLTEEPTSAQAEAATWTGVLRRQPPGVLLKSAHDVEREFRVLGALGSTGQVPVPALFSLCTDPQVLGSSFYIMEYVEGRIFYDPNLPGLSPEERSRVYGSMASTLAALHSAKLPDTMSSFGRLQDYSRRQTERWWKQFQSSMRALSALGDPTLKAMFESQTAHMSTLYHWLSSHIPSHDKEALGPTKGLVHGDYRLDNLLFHPHQPRVVAVLDWELSTMGDQLSDAAYCCMPYTFQKGLSSSSPSDNGGRRQVLSAAAVELLPQLILNPNGTPASSGIPTEKEFLEEYLKAASRLKGVDVCLGDDLWRFYSTLSLFRAAAIFVGVFQRARQGNASSRKAGSSGEVASFLIGRALHTIHSQERLSLTTASTSLLTSITTSPVSPGAAVSGAGLGPSERAEALRRRVRAFIEKWVLPREADFERASRAEGGKRWAVPQLMEDLKQKAKEEGLWNLWLPADALKHVHKQVLREIQHQERANRVGNAEWGLLGPGLTNLEYAHVCMEMGRCVWAPEVFNCSAPDTGNMEVLLRYGTEEQQRQWLLPLLNGEIRSAFAMTEPAVASSDATNICASIVRQGDSYILNGHKWWTSGASDPRCRLFIFMGKHRSSLPSDHGSSTQPEQGSGPKAEQGSRGEGEGGGGRAKHEQQSMVLVPYPSEGVTVVRPLMVFGFDDAPHGHSEVLFKNVRVPLTNMLLGEGRGFDIAQGRLGPGRLHHCMRLIGAGIRALEAMVSRAKGRVAFGRPLAHQSSVLQSVGECKVELEGVRLLLLNAALHLDLFGNKAAKVAIAAAKVQVPRTVQEILDKAIQLHGGAGVCEDFPLSRLWVAARTLRIADGPDEVHLLTIARDVMRNTKTVQSKL